MASPRTPPLRRPALVSRRALKACLRRIADGARVPADLLDMIEGHLAFVAVVDLVEVLLERRADARLRAIQGLRPAGMLRAPRAWAFLPAVNEAATGPKPRKVEHGSAPEVA